MMELVPSNLPSDCHPCWVAIAEYLAQKRPATQSTYLYAIRKWCQFLGITDFGHAGGARMLAATVQDAVRYRLWLSSQPGTVPRHARKGEYRAANNTIANRIAAVRSCYEYLVALDLVPKNPFNRVLVKCPPIINSKRPTEVIDPAKVLRILSLCPKTPKGIRDRAALALLFGGALRRGEVVKLTLGDVKHERGVWFVELKECKNGRDAQQSLPPWAAVALVALRDLRRREGAEMGDSLFISFYGRKLGEQHSPWTADGLFKMFKKRCAAGGVYNASPHSGRKTAITQLLLHGTGIERVKRFARHASIQTTQGYDGRVEDIHNNPGLNLYY